MDGSFRCSWFAATYETLPYKHMQLVGQQVVNVPCVSALANQLATLEFLTWQIPLVYVQNGAQGNVSPLAYFTTEIKLTQFLKKRITRGSYQHDKFKDTETNVGFELISYPKCCNIMQNKRRNRACSWLTLTLANDRPSFCDKLGKLVAKHLQ